jgi:hypothetical protein
MRRIKLRPKNVSESKFKEVIDLVNHIEVRERDYFKKHGICYLGTTKPYAFYESIGRYPDLDFRNKDLMGWEINPAEHLNLGVVAGSGMGKSKQIKNIISQYHKADWRILVVSPKKDEMTSAKNVGHNVHLHPYTSPERLPIISYCPAFIKNYLTKNDFPTREYRFYSHKITSFNTTDAWISLGMSSKMASYCVKLINSGAVTLRDLQMQMTEDILKKKLFMGMDKSANFTIDNLIGTKFIDETLPPLDFAREWGFSKEYRGISKDYRPNNIVCLNYFSQKGGNFMATDIWRILNQVRQTVQTARKDKFREKVLIVLDDVNYYGSKGNPANSSCIQTITDIQINWRGLGIDNITAYQFPEVVDGDIVKGSTTKLVSFIEDPNSVSGILTSDAVNVLRWSEDDGGLVIDKPFNVQWIYRKDNRDWWLYYPNNVVTGHDFG